MEHKSTTDMSLAEANAFLAEHGLPGKKRIDHARWAVAKVRGEEIPKYRFPKTTVATVATVAETETAATSVAEEDTMATKTTKRASKTTKRASKTTKRASNGKGLVPIEYREKYVGGKVKTASGNKSLSCGDAVAQAMAGLDNDEMEKVATENKIDRWDSWSDLNFGQRRMNLGNVLRGKIRRKEGVTIQGKSIKTL